MEVLLCHDCRDVVTPQTDAGHEASDKSSAISSAAG